MSDTTSDTLDYAQPFQVAAAADPRNLMPLDPTDPNKTIDALRGGYHGESSECVGAPKKFCNLGSTSEWQPLGPIAEDTQPGSPIAIFDKNGKYSNTRGQSHAAIYLGRTADGHPIIGEQANGMPFRTSVLPFTGQGGERDAGSYSVVGSAAAPASADAEIEHALLGTPPGKQAPTAAATPTATPSDSELERQLLGTAPEAMTGAPMFNREELTALGKGVSQGIHNVGMTANQIASWAGRNVPGLGRIGQFSDRELARLRAAHEAYRTQYGDSGAGQIGEMIGGTAATLPIMAVANPLIARGAEAGANALGSLVPAAAPSIGRVANFFAGNAGQAAPGMAARPFVSTFSNAANAGLQGAEAAAINSGQSDNPLTQQMAEGALMGGIVGAVPSAAKYAKNALTGAAGSLDPEMANLAANARDMYGIHLKAPQLGLNPTLSYVNSTLKFLPGSGVGADEAVTHGQWQQAINREMGETGSKIFGTTINSALKRAGAEMEAIGNRTNLNFNAHPTALTDLAAIESDARQPISGLDEKQIKQVTAHIDKIIDIAAAHSGDVPGSVYLNLTKRGEALGNLQRNTSTEMAGFGNRIRGVLDDVMQASAAPADAAALQKARYQYKVARTVQPLTARSDSIGGPQPTAGDISPVALRQAVLNPRAFGPNAALQDWGQTPLWDLARIGQRMREPAQSGTAPREAVQNALMHTARLGASAAMGGGGYLVGQIPLALGSVAAGIGAGRTIGAGLRSQALANRMIESSVNPLRYQIQPNPLTRSALAAVAGARANRLQASGE